MLKLIITYAYPSVLVAWFMKLTYPHVYIIVQALAGREWLSLKTRNALPSFLPHECYLLIFISPLMSDSTIVSPLLHLLWTIHVSSCRCQSLV